MKQLTKKKLRKDYTGQVINGHKCLEYVGHKSNYAFYSFECRVCGKAFDTTIADAERYKSCSCKQNTSRINIGVSSGKQKEMLGKTFGMLTVVREDPIRRKGITNIYYYVQCSCGSPEFSAQGAHLKSGGITSCGCKSRSDSCDVFLSELQKEIGFPIEAREVPLSEIMNTNRGYRYDAIIPSMHVLIEVDGQHVHGPKNVFGKKTNDQVKNEYADFLSHELYRFVCNTVADVPMALIRNSYMIGKLKARVADFKKNVQKSDKTL